MQDSYIKVADKKLKPASPLGKPSEEYSNRSSDSNKVYDYEKGATKGFLTYLMEDSKNGK